MSENHKRPYCPHCKLIWNKQSICNVYYCSTCGNRLILKSFNPIPKIIIGFAIIILSLLTLTLSSWFWIGGILTGVPLIAYAIRNWRNIEKLDEQSK